MNKLHLADASIGWYMFHCPGCNTSHSFWTKSPDHPNWQFNNNVIAPTISPSHRVMGGQHNVVCHSFITDGKIHFLNDSTHNLSGRTVDIPSWE